MMVEPPWGAPLAAAARAAALGVHAGSGAGGGQGKSRPTRRPGITGISTPCVPLPAKRMSPIELGVGLRMSLPSGSVPSTAPVIDMSQNGAPFYVDSASSDA